jgi:phospholipid transport system substrate-binding protein
MGVFLFATLMIVISLGAQAGEVKKQEIASVAQSTSAGDVSKEAVKTSGVKQGNYLAKGTPTRAIQELDDMLDDFHVGKLTAQQEEENRELKRKIIHGTFDIHELAKLALAKHWTEISAEEQERFAKLLTDLLEEKALFSKEQMAAKSKSAKKYRVLYKGDKFTDPKQTIAFTRTRVVIPSENIDIGLNYKLKRQDGNWKIFDVIVDEASLVDNYRYQFDSIIKKHGYPDLVKRMTDKLEEFRKKRKDSDKG